MFFVNRSGTTKWEAEMTAEPTVGSKVLWIAEVDRILKRDWCIDTAEAGLSDDDLIRFWRDGDEPAAFVSWFAEKYDLIRFESRPHLH